MRKYSRKHRHWLQDSRMPLLEPAHVVYGPGPEYNGKYSYYENRPEEPDYDTLYLLDDLDRDGFYHEHTHVTCHKLPLDPLDHYKITMILRRPGVRWFWDNWDPKTMDGEPVMETFADKYAICCIYRFRQMKLRRYMKKVWKRHNEEH